MVAKSVRSVGMDSVQTQIPIGNVKGENTNKSGRVAKGSIHRWTLLQQLNQLIAGGR